MAITKANILAALNTALSRNEANVDTCIQSTVEDISKQIDALQAVTTITTQAGTGAYSLPADFKGLILATDSDGHRLDKEFLDDLVERAANVSQCEPDSWAIDSNQIRLCPTPDGVYAISLRYWALHARTADAITYTDKFTDAVNYGTIYRYALSKGLKEDAATYKGLYEEELKTLSGILPKKVRRTQYRDL